MQAESTPEHAWLQRLVGEWKVISDGQEAGWERVRSLGDIWVLCEGEMKMPDGSAGLTLMTLGYDPTKQRFVGTWVGSMMTHMWVYDGELKGNELILSSEGPDFEDMSRMRLYQDVITLQSDDLRLFRGQVQQDDGSWNVFMRAEYSRTG